MGSSIPAPEVPDDLVEEPELDVVPDPEFEPVELEPDSDALLALTEPVVTVPLVPFEPEEPVPAAAGTTTRVELDAAPATIVAAAC